MFIFTNDAIPVVWLQAATLGLLLLILSIWIIWGRGPLRTFFMASVTDSKGKPHIRNITMFAIVATFIFLNYRGAITLHWPPQFVYITLAVMISTWLGLDIIKTISQIKSVTSIIKDNEQTQNNPGTSYTESERSGNERPETLTDDRSERSQ